MKKGELLYIMKMENSVIIIENTIPVSAKHKKRTILWFI